MAGRFARSWALVKASASVLRADKELLVFPAMSAVCTLIVAASFVLPAIFSGAFAHFNPERMTPLLWLVVFAFYLVQYFVIFFFNSALVGAALMRLSGQDPTVGDGFRIASSRITTILGYALVAATVGMILRAIEERAGFIGRWIIGLLGVAWTVATFLTVPVLVNENVGPIDAVTRSAGLLKKTWGENLIGNAGFGFVFGLISLLVVITGVALLIGAAALKSAALAILVGALMLIAFIVIALVQAALQGIYAAALYRYAAEGEVGGGFDTALIANAFRVKA